MVYVSEHDIKFMKESYNTSFIMTDSSSSFNVLKKKSFENEKCLMMES